MNRRTLFLALLLAALASTLPASEEVTSSCIRCHSDPERMDEEGLAIPELFRQDVHAEVGLSCHDCHGGNPSLVPGDADLAMDESFAENPYLGTVERAAIPAFCGRCHSDPTYMKRFQPDPRVDQEQEYRTSRHGKSLAAGNDRVATCIDCHTSHGILGADRPESPIHPTRVAETCRSCHADSERMAGATRSDGRPLATDQYARWRRSVHAEALLVKGDVSAPTCNDCHGNHGAVPPGVDGIAFVCGQCHGREARLFRASAKHAGFEEHNEYMEDAGDDGCAACHESPEPQADLVSIRSFTECATCHGHHAVVRPTVAMLAPLPEIPCAFCHEGAGALVEDVLAEDVLAEEVLAEEVLAEEVLAEEVPEPEKKQRHYEDIKATLLAVAAGSGLEGDELFDWMVDQALALPFHTFADGGDGEGSRLRPEFERLFSKFRIGKTYYTYEDPDGGGEVRGEVVRCSHCHGAESVLADQPVGFETGRQFLGHMRQLTALTGRAERIVLAARRGGVETRDALSAIDGAVDAQIGLEVLVHTFSTDEGSAFAERHGEGLESVRAALTAGRKALEELAFRRRGLAVSLFFILLVAVGLAFKIRQLPER